MAEIIVDFKGVTPAQSTGGMAHIPMGYYLLKVTKVEPRVTNAGQKAVRVIVEVARGPHEGARMSDDFLLDASEKGSIFGKQRFMAFLQACAVAVKADTMKFNGDNLLNRAIVGDVQDNDMPESTDKKPDGTAKYAAKTISRPVAYYNPRALPADVAAKMGMKAGPDQAAAGAAVTAQTEPVAVAVATAPVATAAANGAGVAADIGDDPMAVAGDIDELFK